MMGSKANSSKIGFEIDVVSEVRPKKSGAKSDATQK
jgi:hypothetical protein